MKTSILPVIHLQLSGEYRVTVATTNLLKILFTLETQFETKILLIFGTKILPMEFRGYVLIIYSTESG